jgi:hypothetical protein
VFCDRTYHRTVTDQESPADGIDQESDYIRTKAANAFNWLRFNAGSGVHEVVVKADLETSDPSCAANELAPNAPGPNATCAQAYVGNRTLIVEPTKTANNAVM